MGRKKGRGRQKCFDHSPVMASKHASMRRMAMTQRMSQPRGEAWPISTSQTSASMLRHLKKKTTQKSFVASLFFKQTHVHAFCYFCIPAMASENFTGTPDVSHHYSKTTCLPACSRNYTQWYRTRGLNQEASRLAI